MHFLLLRSNGEIIRTKTIFKKDGICAKCEEGDNAIIFSGLVGEGGVKSGKGEEG